MGLVNSVRTKSEIIQKIIKRMRTSYFSMVYTKDYGRISHSKLIIPIQKPTKWKLQGYIGMN